MKQEENLRERIEKNTARLQELEKETKRLLNDNDACKHSLFKLEKSSSREEEVVEEEIEEPEIPIDFEKQKQEVARGKQKCL